MCGRPIVTFARSSEDWVLRFDKILHDFHANLISRDVAIKALQLLHLSSGEASRYLDTPKRGGTS